AGINVSEAVRSLIPTVTIFELLQLLGKNIETLRSRTFQYMHPIPADSFRLGGLIRSNDMVQRESMMLDRIIMEFNQRKEWVNYVTAEAAALKSLKPQNSEM